jgi:DNA-binding response OmpR family regulator
MPGERILVAEDEPHILGLIVYSLEYAGFEVMEAVNGEDAVRMAADGKPDLILLDVRMPGMSGYEVCTALKEKDTTKHIPVVFISARGQEAEIKRGLEVGAEEYILKPFAPDELYQRVERILRRVASRRGRSG